MNHVLEDNKLAELQQRMYEDMIERPEAEEELVIDTSDFVSKQLVVAGKSAVQVEFLEHLFSFRIKKVVRNFKEVIICIAADLNDINEKTGRPKMFSIEAEIDHKLSYQESVRATIAAFLRHIVGSIRPEILEEA